MRSEIRSLFIEKFNKLVDVKDVYLSESRSQRYEMMLKHYINVADENSCGCFNSPEDILNEIKKSENTIKEYILTGKLTTSLE